MPLKPLTDSPRYNEFIHARDVALEKLHTNAQLRITDVLQGAFHQAMAAISYHLDRMQPEQGLTIQTRQMLDSIDKNMTGQFSIAAHHIATISNDLDMKAGKLALSGEAEAIARALGTQSKQSGSKVKTSKDLGKEDFASEERCYHYLADLKRKIISKLEQSIILDKTKHEILKDAFSVLPKRKSIPSVKKILRDPKSHIKESSYFTYGIGARSGSNKATLMTGFQDDAEWDDLIEDYQNTYIPVSRGPEDIVGVKEETGDTIYNWELERDVTQSFVDEVRSGQVDAANDAGIMEFIWIAIVDDRTDDCCLWRDGLTTKEIEKALQGEHSDDDCDATVPPAHFNCRCTLAPMTEEMPDVPPSNAGEFDDWLTSS